MGRRLAFPALSVTVALAWPGSALAASGQLVNGDMQYTAAAGESNSVTLTLVDDGFGNLSYRVVDAPSVSITPVPPCQQGPSQNVMECPKNGGGTPPVVSFSASLGDGSDSISIQTAIPTSIGGGGGNDTISGGPANDFLRGGQQNDTISGGAGNDQIVGDDPNAAGGGDDSLDGGAGNDSVDGQDGADTVTGGDGDDTVAGGGGNDRLIADNGADDLLGGDGVDLADYSARTQPQFLSLDGVRNDGQDARTDNIATDVENLAGGSGADTLVGSDGPNSLDGGAGGDSITGLGGDDAISAGSGDDAAAGGEGNDTEDGGDGNDTLAGEAGSDSLQGGAGDDSIDGGSGPDVFSGGDGVDTGNYQSRTAPLTVTLDGNAGDGEQGEGDNVQTDVENLVGGSGADTFIGSAAANRLDGGPGEDYSDGGAGSDTLVGGDAGDVLRTRGGAEPDTVSCGPGPDFVVAKPSDTIAPDCDRADRGVSQKPKLRDSAVVAPTTGALQMSPAGIVRRVPLQDTVVLPLRSIVDTVAGAVRVTTAAGGRKTQAVSLHDGAFDIAQAKSAITQFALQGGDFSVCSATAGRTARASKGSSKPVRTLWATGKGKFRTRGRYAAATIRGTSWETTDRCDGTLIKVRRGIVTVRDLVKRRTVTVTAGRSYLARR